MWQIKRMTELTPDEFYAVMKLRVDTFVVEQKRIYPEVDANDRQAYHIFTQDDTGAVLAYARAFTEADGTVTFGRVVVAKDHRGQELGAQLLDQILSCCQAHWPNQPIVIEAQQQVVGFYQRRGFKAEGAPFLFNSTPHVRMRRAA
ncbi:GNAT family N-acetyltransferase [Lacticaseibacillus baoqingensis]|uniref:GNAT family N-acetyltransferase n=1 Tax=Lacticaseibacillus baoqingensis TaxID=2486013 RepID=A0ABW4E4C1_9LACO|nr:GNAT family N-acetyltransferase [Lacticaseibacillus baoqingensis]